MAGGGEQNTELRKSIDELRSVQDRRRYAIWREEATIQGPRVPGSREELELKVVEAAKKVYALSETLTKKEEARAYREEQFQRCSEKAQAAVMTEREMNVGREKRLNYLRRSARCYQDEAKRESNRLAQELLEVRAGNETLLSNLRDALQKKEVASAEQLEELSSKNQELGFKDQELTKICSQLTVRGEETTAAAAATAAPPGDSCVEVQAAEMEKDGGTMGEWAVGAEARTQEQVPCSRSRTRGWGSWRCGWGARSPGHPAGHRS